MPFSSKLSVLTQRVDHPGAQSYRVRVRWLPSRVQSYSQRRICGARCKWCASSGSPRPAACGGDLSPEVFGASAASATAAARAAVGDDSPVEVEGKHLCSQHLGLSQYVYVLILILILCKTSSCPTTDAGKSRAHMRIHVQGV